MPNCSRLLSLAYLGFHCSFALVLASLVLTPASLSRAETASRLAVGLAEAKPDVGPSVELENGLFMVPYTAKIPGTDITFEMIPVPGGEFTMGTPVDNEERSKAEGPTVELKVDPMWVARTETRWDMYKEYMRMYAVFKNFEANGMREINGQNSTDAVTAPTELYDISFTFEFGDESRQPAVTMTQYAAQQFTKWLSRISGIQYRLPTEAEWEYAARGGTDTAYSWGDSDDDMDDYAWHFENSAHGPGLVGTKKPNPFGLFDMHGNVAEWTVNQYTENGYQWIVDENLHNATTTVRLPKDSAGCVVRGGSWEMSSPDLRSAARFASDDELWKETDPCFPNSPWWYTDDPSRGVGFRIFRSAKDLPDDVIVKFWETNSQPTMNDVKYRVSEGRAGYGLVDEGLPDAAAAHDE
ncbi:formylglycine-generating enzyme family protein [Allorhodopirellula solitaria]|uniref:Serine/threonine-protein kinase pkn1 n=1 Tax=Allorhodopirellula solitaria TaxID=2527987 RepID=A0A5C5YFR9_9BACT|nr:SUMF1/EgtB/PvdO family nonheme iron enzyme [Allorhodopirellula solitaria]TWT73924.1 Serine/threonine-protein kinase pkn1 [Allorhodopirellula solitaria]